LIFITATFQVKPEDADDWPQITRAFTDACNAEPGCRFFEWSRSVEDPTRYVLIEAFADGDAGAAHVNSDHFQQARRDLPPHLVATPKIISQELEQDDWNELGELAVE
jgi:quinol monooxygenase YgiN